MQQPLMDIPLVEKRIAWIENAEILGGAELFSLEMLEQLGKQTSKNTQVDVLSQGLCSQFSERLAFISKKAPAHISLTHSEVFFPSLKPIGFSSLLDFFSSMQSVMQMVKKNEYDVVYCNTVRGALVVGIAQIFFPKKTKTIFMSHDYTFPGFLVRIIIPWFHQVLACSYSVKQYLLENGLKPWKAEVIENGVEKEMFSDLTPVEAPLFTVGVIARLAPWKGQMTVLKAAKWLRENAKDYPFTFTLYGVASEKEEDRKYEQELRAYVEKHSLENVTFAGFVPVFSALEESKIVIHASTEHEPFGRVPLEVAAGERVLCTSDIGTPAQIFEDTKTAFFFTAGNARSLAEKLVIIAHNKDTSLQIAKRGREMVESKFDLSVIAKRFWGFF